MVDERCAAHHDRFIRVGNCLEALQQLAAYHRETLGPEPQETKVVLAITGSNGKTTTKDLIVHILRKAFGKAAILGTKGNLNNHIGLPLTLLRMSRTTTMAILEMGTNHRGEIGHLCEIAKPTHGLITNIGNAHTQTLGGIEGVARAKGELFEYLRRQGGTLLVNDEDERVKALAQKADHRVPFPPSQLNLFSAGSTLVVELFGEKVTTRLVGLHNFQNIGAAVGVALELGVPSPTITKALGTFEGPPQRSELATVGRNLVIQDAYNANPDSMKVALDTLARHPGKKMALLADMMEVEDSTKTHEKLGSYISGLNLNCVLCTGPEMKSMARKCAASARWFETKEEMIDSLKTLQPLRGWTILVKGSRSSRMEELIPELERLSPS